MPVGEGEERKCGKKAAGGALEWRVWVGGYEGPWFTGHFYM